MSGTIDISLRWRVRNGNFDTGQRNYANQLTQNGQGQHGGILSVGTSEQVISDGSLTTPGLLWMQNGDETNYIEYGPESGGAMVPFGRLEPGEGAWLRTSPGIVLRAQANTAACKLEYAWYED